MKGVNILDASSATLPESDDGIDFNWPRLFSLGDLMEKLRPLIIHQILGGLKRFAESPDDPPKDAFQLEHIMMSIRILSNCAEFMVFAHRIGLAGTLRAMDHLTSLTTLQPRPCPICALKGQASNVAIIMEAELGGITMMAMKPEERMWFEKKDPFGKDVAKAFPSACFDFEEASDCLAFNRYTACVYHLTRGAEAGLRAMADRLGPVGKAILKPDPSWGNYSQAFEAEIKECKTSKPSPWKAELDFYTGASLNYDMLRRAHRNSVHHLDSKYTDIEARDVMNMCGAFMRHLSTKLSEKP